MGIKYESFGFPDFKDTGLYQKMRELRNRVLLEPFGVPPFSREEDDPQGIHFCAFSKDGPDSQVVGCVLLVNRGGGVAQLRQMAVCPENQGQGIGRELVKLFIETAQAQGYEKIFCHARDQAIPFYEKLGFHTVGDWFQEVGIFHKKMEFIFGGS